MEAIKKFFRKILQFGNEYSKNETTIEVKDYYDNKDFYVEDVVKISRGTLKQDGLFEYANIPDYWKEPIKKIIKQKIEMMTLRLDSHCLFLFTLNLYLNL